MKVLCGIFSFLPLAVFAAAGLLDGSDFTAHYLSGRPTIFCPDPQRPGGLSERRTIYCDYTLLAPVETSHFYTTSGVEADTLVISSISANGEYSTIQTEFDPTTGQSVQELNLWNWLLLRRPLLRAGLNNRHYLYYNLYRGRELVEQGGFSVKVTIGPPRYCPAKVIVLDDPSDCRLTRCVCLRYFRDVNYCQ